MPPIVTEQGAVRLDLRDSPPAGVDVCRTGFSDAALSCTSSVDLCPACAQVGPAQGVDDPFAVDVARKELVFGTTTLSVNTIVFSYGGAVFSSNGSAGPATIARIVVGSSGEWAPATATVVPLLTFGSADSVWGVALGDFNDPAECGVYFVYEPAGGERTIWRLKKDLVLETFAALPPGDLARSIGFDSAAEKINPTGEHYLFVLFAGEDASDASQVNAPQARIWRIDKTGKVCEFGRNFNKPNGIAFHPSGVMLVTEEVVEGQQESGNVLVVTGWRNTFKRGDANGDGTVDVSDASAITNWLPPRNGPTPPACFDAADADDSSVLEQTDATGILDWLFLGAPLPAPPGPMTPGRDGPRGPRGHKRPVDGRHRLRGRDRVLLLADTGLASDDS